MISDSATTFDAAIPSTSLSLPASAHVPGTGTEPDWPPLEAAKVTALQVTTDKTWADNLAYIYGFVLLRAGFYWEAHEVWERVWLACPPNSRERALLRALIQITNAKLKCRMGRPRAASRLIVQAQHDLADLKVAKDETYMGVVVVDLSVELEECAAELRERLW
jgi:hypothetical protein